MAKRAKIIIADYSIVNLKATLANKHFYDYGDSGVVRCTFEVSYLQI